LLPAQARQVFGFFPPETLPLRTIAGLLCFGRLFMTFVYLLLLYLDTTFEGALSSVTIARRAGFRGRETRWYQQNLLPAQARQVLGFLPAPTREILVIRGFRDFFFCFVFIIDPLDSRRASLIYL
jgi:hypothetical protein